jgi:hypothetical protein
MTDSGVLNMTSPRKNLGPIHIVSTPSRSSICPYTEQPDPKERARRVVPNPALTLVDV